MTFTKSAKIIGTSVLLAGFMSGTALAGDKKNCEGKNHSTAQTTVTKANPQSVVLPASTQSNMMQSKTETMKTKNYSFDEALSLCQKHGATDLQACIDKKTGRTSGS